MVHHHETTILEDMFYFFQASNKQIHVFHSNVSGEMNEWSDHHYNLNFQPKHPS